MHLTNAYSKYTIFDTLKWDFSGTIFTKDKKTRVPTHCRQLFIKLK